MENKPMRAVIYARVSTGEQTTENQVLELKKVADRNGWDIEAIYEDTISGAKAKRPQLDKLLKGVVRKDFDVVMVWDVSRLGRSLKHLVELLEDFNTKGVNLYFHQQGIDTTTPSGKMMFQMCGVFAEFERSILQERVKAGLERARAQGKTLGRPKVPPIKVHKIKELREQGLSLRAIAKKTGISHGKVHQLV
jgi:DNA invertase Pin-like site-specific DNA recombinase